MGLHGVIGKGARSMVFSKKQDEQRILSTIRECLFQDDPRMARLNGRPHDDSPLGKDDKGVDEVSYHTAAGIVPEPLIKAIERQAAAQGGAITRDSLVNALAIDQNARPASLLGSSDSPSIASDASPIKPDFQKSISQEISSVRPSVAKRLFRTGAYGAVIAVIVSTAFVWQSSDDMTRGMVKGWFNSLALSSLHLSNNLPPQSDSVAEGVSKSTGQPPQTDTSVILPTASAIEPTPTSTTTDSPPGSSPDLKKQLEAITSDLTLVRQLVEQVATRQDQMARDMATLQVDEQSIRQRIYGPVSPFGRRRSRP